MALSTIGINKYLKIAKEQLETALRLYFEQRDYYSAITLAGAAEEILGKMLNHNGEENLLNSLVAAAVDISKLDGQEVTAKEIRRLCQLRPKQDQALWGRCGRFR